MTHVKNDYVSEHKALSSKLFTALSAPQTMGAQQSQDQWYGMSCEATSDDGSLCEHLDACDSPWTHCEKRRVSPNKAKNKDSECFKFCGPRDGPCSDIAAAAAFRANDELRSPSQGPSITVHHGIPRLRGKSPSYNTVSVHASDDNTSQDKLHVVTFDAPKGPGSSKIASAYQHTFPRDGGKATIPAIISSQVYA